MIPASLTTVHQVFVYGTLKRGQSNHHALGGADFLGRARLHGAAVHDLGRYPMAVLTPGRPGVIHGELYQVDAASLARLDQLEGYPHLYDRQRVCLSNGREAWIYVGSPEQVEGCGPVPYGDWGSTPVFCYGSNLDPEQLSRRCPGWDLSALTARLDGFQWGINKVADCGDGSGYAGVVPNPGSHCRGVVVHLNARDRAVLDRREGVAIDHYRHQTLSVIEAAGDRFPVLVYVPSPDYVAAGLTAAPDYARRILSGAAHWELGSDWLQVLEQSLLITA